LLKENGLFASATRKTGTVGANRPQTSNQIGLDGRAETCRVSPAALRLIIIYAADCTALVFADFSAGAGEFPLPIWNCILSRRFRQRFRCATAMRFLAAPASVLLDDPADLSLTACLRGCSSPIWQFEYRDSLRRAK